MPRSRSSTRASAQFPSTCWSEVRRAAGADAEQQRESLEALYRAYWKPVYAYVRAAWRKQPEDALDLTQAFFTQLLEKGKLARLDPERGSFRGFLKRSLRNFLVDAERRASVRRPDRPVFRIDASRESLALVGPAATDDTPERAYDREWFRALLDAGIADLRAQLERGNKTEYFEAFRLLCLEPYVSEGDSRRFLRARGRQDDHPRYKEVADKLGRTEGDVRYHLSYCRTLLRKFLRRQVRATVATDDQVAAELGELLG